MNEKHEDNVKYINEDKLATQKDLKILSLEIEAKILQIKNDLEIKIQQVKTELELKIDRVESRLFAKLGSLIVASNGIMFALLSYLHK